MENEIHFRDIKAVVLERVCQYLSRRWLVMCYTVELLWFVIDLISSSSVPIPNMPSLQGAPHAFGSDGQRDTRVPYRAGTLVGTADGRRLSRLLTGLACTVCTIVEGVREAVDMIV